jgi:HK97 family phage prohead protease
MQTKNFRAAVKALDPTEGILEAIVSVFNNVDSDNEQIMPGYFTESLSERTPKGVWMHDWKSPVAKTLEAKELMPGDAGLPPELRSLGGLYIKGQFNLSTQRGKEAFSDIQFGIIDEFSIGIQTTKWAYDEMTDVRQLLEGDIYEWSPVLVGANPMTALLSAKDFDGDVLAKLPFKEHFDTVGTAYKKLLERTKWKATTAARKKLSGEQVKELEEVLSEMEEASTAIRELVANPGQIEELGSGSTEEEATSVTSEDAGKALAQFLLTSARMNGVAI